MTNTTTTLTALIVCALTIAPLSARADEPAPETPDTSESVELEASAADLSAARSAFGGGVARGVGGAMLTGGALALIPAITEYNLDYRGEPDIAFLAGTMPAMLTAGLPLLISGIGHHASTRHLPYAQRGAAMRARLARGLTIPWTITGALLGTGALAYFVDLSGEGYVSTPAIVAAASGWSMVAGAGVLAVDGDRALTSLNAPRGRRDNFLRFGVPMLTLGSITLFAVAPAVRTGQELTREVPQAVVAVIGSGAGMLTAGGISMLAGALQHTPKPDFLAKGGVRPRLLAVTPSFDPISKRTGLAFAGTF